MENKSAHLLLGRTAFVAVACVFAAFAASAEMIDVISLGARNDGSVDVSAIVNANTARGSLFFPAGIYKVSHPLVLKNPICGEGYSQKPEPGDPVARNWTLFGAASEQARIAAGMGGDATWVEKYVADQLRFFDSNGMYRDPGCPIVYDFVTRLQYAVTLDCGYDGPSRAKLEAHGKNRICVHARIVKQEGVCRGVAANASRCEKGNIVDVAKGGK